MNAPAILSIVSGVFCLGLGLIGIVRKPRLPAQWSFAAGMTLLALEATFSALSLEAILPEEIIQWQKLRLLVMSFLPGAWILFALTYSSGDYQRSIVRWRPWLILAFIVPVGLTVWQRDKLLTDAVQSLPTFNWMLVLGWPGSALFAVFLTCAILILASFERTLRASVGTMRWKVKFMMVGLGLFFAVRIYACSQSLLYSSVNLSLDQVNSVALLLACLMMTVALFRGGLFDVDVYPSQRLLQNSATVFLAGIYLFTVGVLAKVMSLAGVDAGFQLSSFFLLLALIGLTILLLSDRVRRQTNQFVNRHFRRPHFDYQHVWTTFTERTTFRMQNTDLCTAVVKWVSETFQVLSATIWLVDQTKRQLAYGASTSFTDGRLGTIIELDATAGKLIETLRREPDPVELDSSNEAWTAAFRCWAPSQTGSKGKRLLVPIFGNGELRGLMMLNDRVGDISFSDEDKNLLKCIGNQVAGSLLNIELSQTLLQMKEMEAFQAMSAFFVHDLKNTASTLSLMLQNLPAHFDDPQFRQDALRALSKSVNRINELISRFSLLRQEGELKRTESDLAEVVSQAVADLDGLVPLKVVASTNALPKVVMDTEQIRKVLTNLLVNAIDAAGLDGQICVETGTRPGWAWVSVADNGPGMSPEFVAGSLFRPFRTTKKKGIGIGMFLSKMIVEAHQGRIEVVSQPGRGAIFKVLLPLKR